MTPVSADMTTSIRSAGVNCANMVVLLVSGQVQRYQQQVDQLDADEGEQYASAAIAQHVSPQDGCGTDRAVFDALERQRYQSRNDQRVEDYRRQDGAVRRRKVHDVEGGEHGIGAGERRRN